MTRLGKTLTLETELRERSEAWMVTKLSPMGKDEPCLALTCGMQARECPPMDDLQIAALMRRVEGGDAEALEDLLASLEPDVRASVRRRLPRALRSDFDSMDFVQSVWRSVLSGEKSEIARHREPAQLRGYLAGIAKNKVFEAYRRRTKTKKYNLAREEALELRRGEAAVAREPVARDPSPSQEVQAVDRFSQMTAGCPSEEVRIIGLRRDGLTFDEIAAKTGKGEKSVRRVIESLRRRMEARRWL